MAGYPFPIGMDDRSVYIPADERSDDLGEGFGIDEKSVVAKAGIQNLEPSTRKE